MQGIASVRNWHPVERQKETAQTKQGALESVCNLSALMIMDERCCRGVRHKNSVARHQLLSASKNLKISNQLKNGKYKIRKGRELTVYEPKKRIVTNMYYPDRIVLASFSVNYFYPKVIPNLIPECFACIKGRGVDKARKCFADMLRRADPDDIVISADFENYFGSINHDLLAEEITIFFDDPWAREFFKMAIDCNKKTVGIGLGSELNQLSACAFPNRLDHKLRAVSKSYTRYMDDIKIICGKDDRDFVLNVLKEETARLRLRLSAKKTYSHSVKRPVSFLGFIYKRHDSGRVTMKRDPEKIKREKRKLRRMKESDVPFDKIEEHYKCSRATIKKGTRSGLVKMDRFFNNLFEEEIMEKKKRDVATDMALKEALVTSRMIKESSDEDMAINTLIREKYSMSQELALHRKKLLGTATDEEWQEYNEYVEECIEKARERA